MVYRIIAGIVLVLGGWIAVSLRRFDRMVRLEADGVFRAMTASEAQMTGQWESLPEPVQRYLNRAVPDGYPPIRCARLKQMGSMRLSADQPWKPFTAVQYITVEPPAFLWYVRFRYLPVVPVVGRDLYQRERGHMLIKALATLPVVDADDPKTTAGAFIRYVAELIWLPAALANNPTVRWEAIDEHSARAMARDGDVEAEVVFHFNADGDIDSLESHSRYRNATDDQPTPWVVKVRRTDVFDGVRVPGECEVGWVLDSGYFAWWRGTIMDLEYNLPERYE